MDLTVVAKKIPLHLQVFVSIVWKFISIKDFMPVIKPYIITNYANSWVVLLCCVLLKILNGSPFPTFFIILI